MKTALLIVDVQNDFAQPDGALYVRDGFQVVPVINALRSRAPFDLVVVTRDYHPPGHVSFWSSHRDRAGAVLFQPLDLGGGRLQVLWPDHCVQGSAGAELHPDLVVLDSDLIVKKGTDPHVDSYSAFMDNDQSSTTGIGDVLEQEGIGRVVVVGLAFDYCVGLTALDAKRAGLEVVVCVDASRSVNEGSEMTMVKKLKDAGISMITTEQYLLTLHP